MARVLAPLRSFLCVLLGMVATAAIVASASAAGTARTLHTLYSFCKKTNCTDGASPRDSLLRDSNGNLFGVTVSQGKYNYGTVFEIRSDGTERNIHDFCAKTGCSDGIHPHGKLIADVNGAIYGLADEGGSSRNGGVVYKLVPNADRSKWHFVALYTFCRLTDACLDGKFPGGGLAYIGAETGALYDGVSPLYGTAVQGGETGNGVVFKLTFDAEGKTTETVLHSFCTDAECNDRDGSHPLNG